MEECKEGKKEGLLQLVKILEYQECCELGLNDVIREYVVLREKGLYRYREGLIEKPHSVVMELGLNGVIEVNVESHELLNVDGIEHAKVLDLSDDGERWEGDVLNGEPYGWGVFYDSENRRVYEGFRMGDVNVCYGTRYYSDIQKVDYVGEWCEGKRWGRGVQYDRKGNKVFEGEWMDDKNEIEKQVKVNEEYPLLHSCIEELIVGYKSGNGYEWSVLNLSFMSNLRVFRVSDKSFKNVEEVRLIGLNQLEEMSVGENSFTSGWGRDPEYNPKRRFYLKNCKTLAYLVIGCYSFSDYSVCEIENMPYLQVIGMGEDEEECYSFYYASLKLKSDCERQK